MPEKGFGATYFFRGDSNYRGGPIGKALGVEADSADIQNCADHVLRKESRRSSRYSSFTTEVAIARKFTSAEDNRYIRKVKTTGLLRLIANGTIRLLDPETVYNELLSQEAKLVRQAADVRATMLRNNEVLIEGQLPIEIIETVN